MFGIGKFSVAQLVGTYQYFNSELCDMVSKTNTKLGEARLETEH